jgi:integrase/recombinase XerD
MQKTNKKITLWHFKYQDKTQIKIDFEFDQNIIRVLKTINGIKYSKTNNCWYIENNSENLNNIFKAFKDIAWIDGKNFFKEKVIKEQLILQEAKGIKLKVPDEFIEKLKLKRYS